ncbi:MAG: EamA family transporter [Clostridia bacterium]|nr:EamA family transporter [Clostridia bacterium]
MIYSLLAFALWGVADLFYKKGNSRNENYNDIITGIIVGIVMGIHALIYAINNSVSIDIKEIVYYLPVSFCYIFSMVVGYKALRYIELSIASPVQNTSGVITSLLLILFFKSTYPILAYVAFFLVFIGIFYICMLERKEGSEERKFTIGKDSKWKILAIALPIIYCLFDGLGTFLDGIYLDKLELISEDNALVAYEATFLLFSICAIIYLRLKHINFMLHREKDKIAAAIFETAGQYFYVFAMANDSVISATIVGSYCILSMLLGRVFLKEKLSVKKYVAIAAALIGIVMLCILQVD